MVSVQPLIVAIDVHDAEVLSYQNYHTIIIAKRILNCLLWMCLLLFIFSPKHNYFKTI
jgi:hypothetical protein